MAQHIYLLKPKTRVAIVTCMDSRLHVAQALGLVLGDAHILRNAGGRVTEDMIRSLVISQQQMGTREIGSFASYRLWGANLY
ncbi:beta-carbonic anhydrase 1 (plasmid) [Streptococcus dysgalactiae]|nr:beta-carbonic anhydrase 1 [Streptococcus dysgalactiae]